MKLIEKYFELSPLQKELFEKALKLYVHWNSQINLISRKDIENLEERHFLHSLAIAKFISFKPGTSVLDLGCGGGFPGIMLAILFPDVQFTLIDGRNKKIMVVKDIASNLDLKNVVAIHGRAEELKDHNFEFVVTRAVAKIDQLKEWTYRLFSEEQNHSLPNGIIALKGNLSAELLLLTKKDYFETISLKDYYDEEFFLEKELLYVQY